MKSQKLGHSKFVNSIPLGGYLLGLHARRDHNLIDRASEELSYRKNTQPFKTVHFQARKIPPSSKCHKNRKLLWATLKCQTQNGRRFYWSLPFLPRYKLDCPIKPSCPTRISRWTFSNFALPFPYKSVKITTPITTTDWSPGSCHSMCIGTEEGGGTVMYKRWSVALLEWSSALGRSIN